MSKNGKEKEMSKDRWIEVWKELAILEGKKELGGIE